MRRTAFFAAPVLVSTVLLSGCGSDDTAASSDSGKSTTSTETDEDATAEVVSQPFNASGLFAGDANPSLPDGDAREVAVVATAPLDKDKDFGSASLAFVFRNNTDQSLSDVDWSATARAGGELVATGSNHSTIPSLIAPGEVGVSYIYFEEGLDIPDAGATYEFTPQPREADGSVGRAPLVVGEIHRKGETVVGTATNETGKGLAGPYGVEMFCFDGDEITGWGGSGFTEEDANIDPDGQVHFTEHLVGDCKTYALTVGGFYE